jgi:D-amino-acid oxidase
VAAALWYPYRAYPFERVTSWSRSSYAAFESLTEVDGTGVSMLAGTELHRSRTADPWWRGAVPVLTRVTALDPPYVDGWSFVAPVVDMPVYLRWLTARVEGLGGTVTRMALPALPDRPEIVVNATGLGARRMADDPSTVPVRGQVVYVEQFGLERWWLDSGSGEGPVYVVPRSRVVVVGGTDDEGEWDLRPDPAVATRILERAAEVVPALTRARVVGHRVGLRPARPEVRLELEETAGGGRVVHCYGHGGAGVTLSWGCADEVAGLVAQSGRTSTTASRSSGP